ncbi:MAG TPA: PIG-L family deacetylase [Planctomycetota bacterium]|nr:PIG-L family deacetylase [Planctomycetota bacterium]
MATPKQISIVAVGAHVDDHWYGMGGTLLKAARKGHRVTVIQAVTTYCSWPVVKDRETEIKPHVERISQETGVRVVPLGYDYLRLVNGPDLSARLAEAITAAEPDILFCPWEEDSNQDHAALGTAARVAGMHAPCFLPADRKVKLPRQIFQYALDANARNFRPDAFVNTSDVLFDMLQLNNVFDEIYSKSPLWPNALRRATITDHHGNDRTITVNAQSEYIHARSVVRGLQCGARYAEGFAAYKGAPADADLLAQI